MERRVAAGALGIETEGCEVIGSSVHYPRTTGNHRPRRRPATDRRRSGGWNGDALNALAYFAFKRELVVVG